MRIKMTAFVLSALLPLTASAVTEQIQEPQGQAFVQGQQKMQKKSDKHGEQWHLKKMQERQAQWFDRLELTPEQRQNFKEEMQAHRATQAQARAKHHNKLRSMLNDKQRVQFDQDIRKMQKHMHYKTSNKFTGETKR